jgi:hypothetical protein
MKKKNQEQRRNELLRCICKLPRQMTLIHGADNMTEFLLHHLADPNCFNFSKAAYFVDNPDFNLFKGVAGFHRLEAFQEEDHWGNPKQFTSHMKDASFNRRVRTVGKKSHKKENKSKQEIITSLAQELELEKPAHHAWKMKYDNHGLLIFELANEDERDLVEENLEESLYLFGFAPVF